MQTFSSHCPPNCCLNYLQPSQQKRVIRTILAAIRLQPGFLSVLSVQYDAPTWLVSQYCIHNLCRATSGGYIRFWLLVRFVVPRKFIFHGQCFGRGVFFWSREVAARQRCCSWRLYSTSLGHLFVEGSCWRANFLR